MALTQVTSGLISSVSNTAISGLITSAQIASVANTQITGVMTASQIATVANTQITGLITSGQIASVANTQVTGNITGNQIAATAVTPGNYGGSTQHSVFTVDQQGRITSAANATPSIANTQITGLITSGQIVSIANTQITGNIISSQITSVANTQITGNIISSQITSVANTQVTGVFTAAQGGTGVTSSTGSGSVVLSTSPSLTTPVLGTPTSGNLSNCTVDGTNGVGFINIPINSQSAAYTLVLADAGKAILHPSTDANARTFTIPANTSVAFAIGTAVSFINMTSQVVTIAITTDTMYLSSAGTTGSRSLAQYGTATAVKMTSTTWIISGSGLT